MKLSMVILPTSNEAANIGALLERLLHTSGLDEVGDSGSTDGTPVPVRSSAVRLVHSGAGKTAYPRGPMANSPRR